MRSRYIIGLLLVSLSLVASQKCIQKAQEYAIQLNTTLVSTDTFADILQQVNGCCHSSKSWEWCQWTWTYLKQLAKSAFSENSTTIDQRLPALQQALAKTIVSSTSAKYIEEPLRQDLNCTRGPVDCQREAKLLFENTISQNYLSGNQKDRMKGYALIMNLGKNSTCFSQSPRCLGFLALTAINFKSMEYISATWAPQDLHTRLFRSHVESCMGTAEPIPPSPQPDPKNESNTSCLIHLVRAQQLVNTSISTASNYDDCILDLRGARTLAQQFSQCVSEDGSGAYSSLCVQLSESLPNIITTAIFTSTSHDLKRRVETIFANSLDLLQLCSASGKTGHKI